MSDANCIFDEFQDDAYDDFSQENWNNTFGEGYLLNRSDIQFFNGTGNLSDNNSGLE